ncbi:hypothetical protein K469DRAFT_683912 [Zopfia rhizophila CBS 207.26]|uniref:Uncharacterized protein n=1 Tax=Zopfia rhizophila CBS 207.26 TaxID=1314779 RepID=A0A6A6DBD4_9PEZI|nr:hypothetical protein K469DRAFT_683912 [Zopfia rhizophila CBS 207.26]
MFNSSKEYILLLFSFYMENVRTQSTNLIAYPNPSVPSSQDIASTVYSTSSVSYSNSAYSSSLDTESTESSIITTIDTAQVYFSITTQPATFQSNSDGYEQTTQSTTVSSHNLEIISVTYKRQPQVSPTTDLVLSTYPTITPALPSGPSGIQSTPGSSCSSQCHVNITGTVLTYPGRVSTRTISLPTKRVEVYIYQNQNREQSTRETTTYFPIPTNTTMPPVTWKFKTVTL